MEIDVAVLYLGWHHKARCAAKKIAADRRVMTKQLDELLQDGFITKCSYETKIPKVEYQLTPLGKSLLPLIMSLEEWGESNTIVLEAALTGKSG